MPLRIQESQQDGTPSTKATLQNGTHTLKLILTSEGWRNIIKFCTPS
jgi:hypothetical protein